MYVGEPPERVDVPRGGVIHLGQKTPLQSANPGTADLLVCVYGYPPESERALKSSDLWGHAARG
jgi:hypothetical protein